jgi:2'-5' RNA ligase
MTDEAAEKPERLFIAVPLTDEARQGLQKLLPRNLPGKPVPPPNWHFTLRFLGATLPSARDQIIAWLKAATCGAAFTVRFSELGAFPHPRRARILWVGVETKEFKPHLTLSRIEPPVSVKTLVSPNTKVGLRMPVHAMVLYRSRLGGGPARYEEVARFELSR